MPETRAEAVRRAERLGFPRSHVICLDRDDDCYIVPHGIDTAAGRKAYAEARASGRGKEYAAKVAHTVDDQARR